MEENYVVRIYRFDGKNPRKLIGLVEEVGVEGQRAFRNLEELWAILNPSEGRKATRKRKEKDSGLSARAMDLVRSGKVSEVIAMDLKK